MLSTQGQCQEKFLFLEYLEPSHLDVHRLFDTDFHLAAAKSYCSYFCNATLCMETDMNRNILYPDVDYSYSFSCCQQSV